MSHFEPAVVTQSSRALRAIVDRGKCCGYTLCAEICPEVYELDDQGFATTDGQPISPDLQARAREGAAACPERAITIVED